MRTEKKAARRAPAKAAEANTSSEAQRGAETQPEQDEILVLEDAALGEASGGFLSFLKKTPKDTYVSSGPASLKRGGAAGSTFGRGNQFHGSNAYGASPKSTDSLKSNRRNYPNLRRG